MNLSFVSGLGQHYHIEEDIVRIPRKKVSDSAKSRASFTTSFDGATTGNASTAVTTAIASSTSGVHALDFNPAALDARDLDDDDEVDEVGNDDGDYEDDDDDSYVNITVKREDDLMAEASKVVEISGSVDERRSQSFIEG